MKTCTKCKIKKPANTEYFHRAKKSKDGLNPWCKDCRKEYREKQKAKNKKKEFIYDDKIMKACAECRIEKPATPDYFYRNKSNKDGLVYTCKECRKEYNKKHFQDNREDMLEYGRNHYKENREEKIEYSRNYYKENREHYSEYKKKYYLENPEVSRLSWQRRQARMAQLPHTLTVEEWEDSLEYFNHSCAYCGVSDERLTQEHVIPLSKGGPYTQDNIIPACKSCNSSKHATDLEEWYVSYRHYDEDRLNKILDYIEINS